jgi:hypothetical protein
MLAAPSPSSSRLASMSLAADMGHMGLMGWSTTAMAARYQHITGAVRGDVAERIGGLIWGSAAGK